MEEKFTQKLSLILKQTTMEIKGRIIAVLDKKQGTSQKDGKAWASQEFVIETMEQYPKRCVFNVFGEDKLKQFNIQQGSECLVKFDINAREYNGRWYNDVRAWKVEPIQAQAPANFPAGSDAIPAPTIAPPNDDTDPLPF
jgi:hypothetical protein